MSLAEKLKVVQFVKSGKSQTAAAEHLKCSRTSVVKMIKDETSILEAAESSLTPAGKRKNFITNAKCKLMDALLQNWHMRLEIDAPSLNVTGDILKEKAIHFRDVVLEKHGSRLSKADKDSLENFKASNGWLEKYLHRIGSSSVRRCGEHSSTNP